jgi:hypothetical protein
MNKGSSRSRENPSELEVLEDRMSDHPAESSSEDEDAVTAQRMAEDMRNGTDDEEDVEEDDELDNI